MVKNSFHQVWESAISLFLPLCLAKNAFARRTISGVVSPDEFKVFLGCRDFALIIAPPFLSLSFPAYR